MATSATRTNGVNGLVSIIVSFLNSERFLAEAIESVLAQSHTHWELFLVDDGSTDRSTAIAREYATESPTKIHYLEHPRHRNCGLTDSRNLGARASVGEYLAFIDADDVWLPHKLAEQVALMDAKPEVGRSYGHSEYWYDWDVSSSTENEIPPLAPGGKIYYPPDLLIACYPIGEFGAPCPSSFILRRSTYHKVEGFVEHFNSKTHQLYEDQAILAKIYLNTPVYVSERCWDKYRCHPLSMGSMAQETRQEEAERSFYFKWVYRYLRQQDIKNPVVWAAIRRRAWEYELPLPLTAARFARKIGNILTFI